MALTPKSYEGCLPHTIHRISLCREWRWHLIFVIYVWIVA